MPAVAGASSAHDHAVILFDGTCAFCEGAVKFIARRDPAGYFKYGASQLPTAAALLAPHGIDRETARSIVLIEAGQIYLRSTASLRIARRLPFPWSLAGALLVVPRPLRDAVYRVVAAVRQRLAGSSNACEVPPPEIRQRLRGSWSYTHAALSQDSPGLLEGGADAFKDDRLSGAPRQPGSLLAS